MNIEEVKEEYLEEESKKLPEKSKDSLSAVVNQINEEQDVEKIKDLTKLFNLALMKKEIKRAEKQSDMLDYALNEVQSRLITGVMEDKDLAKYIQILQDSINTTRKNTTEEALPVIQITKNEFNINNDESLTREERENIQKVIQMILTSSKEEDVIDVESNEKESIEEDD